MSHISIIVWIPCDLGSDRGSGNTLVLPTPPAHEGGVWIVLYILFFISVIVSKLFDRGKSVPPGTADRDRTAPFRIKILTKVVINGGGNDDVHGYSHEQQVS